MDLGIILNGGGIPNLFKLLGDKYEHFSAVNYMENIDLIPLLCKAT